MSKGDSVTQIVDMSSLLYRTGISNFLFTIQMTMVHLDYQQSSLTKQKVRKTSKTSKEGKETS